jgi:hypothetical protein
LGETFEPQDVELVVDVVGVDELDAGELAGAAEDVESAAGVELSAFAAGAFASAGADSDAGSLLLGA